jgi:TonB family protein
MANSLPLWDFSPDAREILASLKVRIALGTEEIDTILRRVAESAQALTGADGSAIAIRSREEVLCRARSGVTAPPLGSRLDAESGISGECLLTGAELCCNDTAVDPRVDPEVCRLLGLHAVAVSPIGGTDGVAGILEVFSTHKDAFTTEHMVSLKCLAGLIESACASNSVGAFAAVAGAQRREPELDSSVADSPREAPVVLVESGSAAVLDNRPPYWAVGLGAVVLLLIAFIALRNFRPSAKPAQLSQEAIPQAVLQIRPSKPSPSTEPAPRSQESSAGSRRREASADEEQKVEKASEVLVLSRTGHLSSVKSAPAQRTDLAGSGLQASAHDPNYARAAAPPPLAATDSPSQEALLLPAPTLPKLALPISQGISGGALQHRVKPIYPSGAIAQNLEGAVVVAATITKTGDVRDPKLLRGDPILGQAALLAVRQWHYQPYRLDGQPVEMETEITVQFKAK